MKLHRNSNIKTTTTLCNGSLINGVPYVDYEAPLPKTERVMEHLPSLIDSEVSFSKAFEEAAELEESLTETTEVDSLEDDVDDTLPKTKLGRMEISEIERQWALDIKAAVEEDKTLAPLSDLEYVQHAIVAKDKVGHALKRIRKQQAFKLTHGIVGYGDAEQGIAITGRLFDRFPGSFMSYGKVHSGSIAQFVEVAKFSPEGELRTEEQIKEHLLALYYTYSVMVCDIEAMREGAYWVADAANCRWKNFSYRVERRAADFCDSYPIRFKGILVFDAPLVLAAIYNIIKPCLSPKVRSSIRTTTREAFLMENDLPDEILPMSLGGSWDPEDVKEQVADLVRYRYHNLETFRL